MNGEVGKGEKFKYEFEDPTIILWNVRNEYLMTYYRTREQV